MKKYLETVIHILRHFGFSWLIYRFWYAFQIKSGILRFRIPGTAWNSYDVRNHSPGLDGSDVYERIRQTFPDKFFFKSDGIHIFEGLLKNFPDPRLTERVSNLANGNLTFFSKSVMNTGFPPDWFVNSQTNHKMPHDLHWSRIGDFEYGDIKIVWEPSRFGFVFDLAREYTRTKDDRCAEMFWMIVDDWMKSNTPNCGPNWKCGQESTFRMMAWVWGLSAFLEHRASTRKRMTDLLSMIYFSGFRIEKNLSYALSQRNNHSISEAVGLWTIGILFPEFRNSARWKEKGKRLIEKLSGELIHDDGSFVQNSVNYHRLLLHDLLWALRLGDLNDEPFTETVREQFRKAFEFLYRLCDPSTGLLPNYGANDGALILPLSNSDYRDYRPVLQACHYYLFATRCFEAGPWDEDLLWLFGPEALNSEIVPKQLKNLTAEVSGYYTIRTDEGMVFLRCGRHKTRPGQQDMLHCDIWWKGRNIVIDPGSYSYNAPPPWENGLGQTIYHNTVSVDGMGQMDSYGKFMSFPWVQGTLIRRSYSEPTRAWYLEGTHNGYERLKHPVRYSRGVLILHQDIVIVVDRLASVSPHAYRLHWLLNDFEYTYDPSSCSIRLNIDDIGYSLFAGVVRGSSVSTLVRGDERSPRGWQSAYYNHKEPALSFDLVTENTEAMFYSVLGPGISNVVLEENTLRITAGEETLFVKIGGAVLAEVVGGLGGKAEDRSQKSEIRGREHNLYSTLSKSSEFRIPNFGFRASDH